MFFFFLACLLPEIVAALGSFAHDACMTALIMVLLSLEIAPISTDCSRIFPLDAEDKMQVPATWSSILCFLCSWNPPRVLFLQGLVSCCCHSPIVLLATWSAEIPRSILLVGIPNGIPYHSLFRIPRVPIFQFLERASCRFGSSLSFTPPGRPAGMTIVQHGSLWIRKRDEGL